MSDHVATVETDIKAPVAQVWQALTEPEQIKEYMFGAEVVTDWVPGDPIAWKGTHEGREYVDHGKVLEVDPERRLTVTHFSPLSGQDDIPANYHTIVYQLEDRGSVTRLVLTQDNNAGPEEAERSARMWEQMFDGLKQHVEAR